MRAPARAIDTSRVPRAADGLVEERAMKSAAASARRTRPGQPRAVHGLGRRPGAQGRGRCIRVGLHVVDREGEIPVIPGTEGVLVEAVGAPSAYRSWSRRSRRFRRWRARELRIGESCFQEYRRSLRERGWRSRRLLWRWATLTRLPAGSYRSLITAKTTNRTPSSSWRLDITIVTIIAIFEMLTKFCGAPSRSPSRAG